MGFPGLLDVFLTLYTTLGVVAAIAVPGSKDSTRSVGPSWDFSSFPWGPPSVIISPASSPFHQWLQHSRGLEAAAVLSPGSQVTLPLKGRWLASKLESFQAKESVSRRIPLERIGVFEGKFALTLGLCSASWNVNHRLANCELLSTQLPWIPTHSQVQPVT